jgi:hypothetical protein
VGRRLCLVRPAWALSCGCKSRAKGDIPIEANRNCVKVTERGKGSGSEAAGRCTKTGFEGDVERGERAKDCEVPMLEAQANQRSSRIGSGARVPPESVFKWLRNTQTLRTARCGPACRLVWQGPEGLRRDPMPICVES